MANASSAGFRLRARIGGRRAAVCLIVTLSSVMLAATPAAACDLVDPTCVVEIVEETVDPATETVEDATGDVVETVEETVEETEETTETVDETVETVTGEADETIQEVVGPVIGPVDDGIDGPSPPGADPDPVPPPAVDPAPSDGGNGPGGDGSGGGDQPAGTPLGALTGPIVVDPLTLVAAPSEDAPAPGGFLSVLAGPAGQIASQIAFPLALALLVFLFVAFQHRLDGRDPKLALAATSPDVLRFG